MELKAKPAEASLSKKHPEEATAYGVANQLAFHSLECVKPLLAAGYLL